MRIEENIVYDNFKVNIYVDNSINVVVNNNISYCDEVSLSAIAVGEEFYSGWGAQLDNISITRNSIDGCRYGFIAFTSYVGGTLSNVRFSENIIQNGTYRSISLNTKPNMNVHITDNGVYSLDFWIRSSEGVFLEGNYLLEE